MHRPGNPYFARSIVNRVWANYFNVGIVEPPDDLNLANPPSNGELLDYLSQAFVEHHYDLKWLHREITSSRTYQLSWRPNDTNRQDTRNFSHAVPRRLPAEVAYDAMSQATAGAEEALRVQREPGRRMIGIDANPSAPGRARNAYLLSVFGKPERVENCDCERSNDPSLLQTLFLQNDNDVLTLLDRPSGWPVEVSRRYASLSGAAGTGSAEKGRSSASQELAASKLAASNLERRLRELKAERKYDQAKPLEEVLQAIKRQQKAAPESEFRARSKCGGFFTSRPRELTLVDH